MSNGDGLRVLYAARRSRPTGSWALSAQYLPGHGKSITIDFVGRLPYLLNSRGE